MRALLFVFLSLFLTSQSWALPDCRGSYGSHWDNCFGTYTWASGNKYVGEFKDGKANGQGTYTWANGDKYVGEWKDNKLHGQGTFTFANGNKYVGEYKDNNMHGQGVETHHQYQYVGQFKDSMYHGQGTWTVSEDFTHYIDQNEINSKKGDRYVGEWAHGLIQGSGIYYHADGRVEEGYWKGFKLVKTKDGQAHGHLTQAEKTQKNQKKGVKYVTDTYVNYLIVDAFCISTEVLLTKDVKNYQNLLNKYVQIMMENAKIPSSEWEQIKDNSYSDAQKDEKVLQSKLMTGNQIFSAAQKAKMYANCEDMKAQHATTMSLVVNAYEMQNPKTKKRDF